MQRLKDRIKSADSSTPKGPHSERMQKPKVHTTKNGTQFVRITDIVQSEAGWNEIQRLKEANLVQRQPPSEQEPSQSSSKNDK